MQVTFKLAQGTAVVVHNEDTQLYQSDEALAQAAGFDFTFACQECSDHCSHPRIAHLCSNVHFSLAQALMLRGVDEQRVHIARVKSIKHAGWTLDCATWAVMTTCGVSELVYVHEMIQYDGMLRKIVDGQEESAYESGHIFLKCFRFTFKQLRLEKDANTLRVHESRLATLLQAIQSQGSSARINNVQEFPFHVADCDQGMWSWGAINLYDLISDQESTFAPVFFARRLHGHLVFTYR